jgi:hypothetical protein
MTFDPYEPGRKRAARIRRILDQRYIEQGYLGLDDWQLKSRRHAARKRGLQMKPDPSVAAARMGEAVKGAQAIRDKALAEHMKVDERGDHGEYRYSPQERHAEHQRIRDKALAEIDALNVSALNVEVRNQIAEAHDYLETDAILQRARFHPAAPENSSAELRVNTELLEQQTRARWFAELANYDDAGRARLVEKAAKTNDLAMLGVLKTVTDAESRAHGAESVTKTRAALVGALRDAEPPKFDRWLASTADELESGSRQITAIRASLVSTTPPSSTIAERAAAVTAARISIPISDSTTVLPNDGGTNTEGEQHAESEPNR